MLKAQAECLAERLEEIKPLLPVHWEKLALDKEAVPLDPQYALYLAREEAGQLLLVTLRDDGKMIGYWIAFVCAGLHYQTCLTATMDIWNLLPDYENGVAAMILMKEVHREYKRLGVNRSFASEKIHKPCGRLFKAFGYEAIETHYSKLIGGPT